MKSLAFVTAVAAIPAFAQDMNCSDALGTYLVTKDDTSGVAKGTLGRTILSLAPEGFAIMTDSAQGGIEGYQAFGMMQGTWGCGFNSDGSIAIDVTLLDFSYPDASDPIAKLARVSLNGALTPSTDAFSGSARIALFSLYDDPLSDAPAETNIGYVFDGARILTSPLAASSP